MVVWPVNAVHLFDVVHLPMVYAGRLLIGHHFQVRLKILLRDHVDCGDELTVAIVGPVGTYWPRTWFYIDCAKAWCEGGIPGASAANLT